MEIFSQTLLTEHIKQLTKRVIKKRRGKYINPTKININSLIFRKGRMD